ncbi:Trans-2,3-dihydro-3-hydroxyanthranilate isomerase protein [Dioscorea alata]|uniref:Trans-2,3-dihydro-3-hydroxyanthranilate isomerase protein n=1 Tax=Dioscorea alata TaxID=55571 RepID=A0ACB7VRC5_DIOAL|nr:Trans-2,3-dihydro-3-hydroxyanthranilate isomerase protein [Dioscorea alata]
MATRAVRYAVIDAFTDTAFKGNPAAVCFLEDGYQVDDEWMQSVAKEFNISETAFLTRAVSGDNPRFNLRWFTPVDEVEVASGLDVVNLKPKFDEIRNCAGIGVIVTGPAPPGSGYDIFSRYFCPKLGLDEASPRGGRLDLTLDENAERVYIISFRFSLSPAFFFLYFRRQNMLFDEPCRNLV